MKHIAELGHVIPVRDVPMWAFAKQKAAGDASPTARKYAMGFFATKAIWIAEQTVDGILNIVAWDRYNAVKLDIPLEAK